MIKYLPYFSYSITKFYSGHTASVSQAEVNSAFLEVISVLAHITQSWLIINSGFSKEPSLFIHS